MKPQPEDGYLTLYERQTPEEREAWRKARRELKYEYWVETQSEVEGPYESA